MKFPEILIGKPVDPFPSASLGGSTEYMLGWQEDVLPARPGGLGLRKNPNPFPGGYLPTSRHGYCKDRWHSVGLFSRRDTDAELEMLRWQWGINSCPCRNLPRTVFPDASCPASQLELSHEAMAPLFHPATGKEIKNGRNQRERCFPLNQTQATKTFQKGSV